MVMELSMVRVPPAQVQRRGGVVRGGLVMAAFRAAESADVVVVDVVIFHGGMAHRTAGPSWYTPVGDAVSEGQRSRPNHFTLSRPRAKQLDRGSSAFRISSVSGWRAGKMASYTHSRWAVPGQLVPVEIGDDELRGVEVPEALGCVPLVGLDQQHIRPHRPVRDAWVSTSVVTPSIWLEPSSL